MATDIASLGIRVQVLEAERAKRDLKDITHESGRAEEATNELANQVKALAVAYVSIEAAKAVITNSIGAWSALDKGLIGVQKTTGLLDSEMGGLRNSIEGMSHVIPVTTRSLLEIAQAAGQLGISGKRDIEVFTKTIAQLEIASDLTGEAAATSLARLLNVSGEAIQSVNILGSVIVALGNNMAASESEIVRLATEIGAASSVFAVTAADSMALGAAMKSMGVRAELGGSVVGRSMQTIDAAIREGGETFEYLQEVTGMTGDQIEKTFKTDSTAVFQAWIEGIGGIVEANGSAAATLERFGLKGQEVLKVIPAMATQSHLLAKALEISAKEQENATALVEEAKKASESFSSQMIMTGNTIGTVAAKIGEIMAPAILGITTGFRDWAKETGNIETALEGLAVTAKLTLMGGALYLAPPIIAAGFTAAAAAAETLALGVMMINTPMWGVAASATAASGAVGALTVASGVLFAAYAGWKIGTYLSERFEVVRVAGVALVEGLVEGWEYMAYGAKVAFAGMEFAYTGVIWSMKQIFAEYLLFVADGLSHIPGMDGAADSLFDFADGLKAGKTPAKELTDTMAGLNKELDATKAANDLIFDSMYAEATASTETTDVVALHDESSKPIGAPETPPSPDKTGTDTTVFDAIQRRVDALTLEAAILGKTTTEAVLYKLALEGATPEQLKAAAASLALVDAFELQEEQTLKASEALDEQARVSGMVAAKLDELTLAAMSASENEAELIRRKYDGLSATARQMAMLGEISEETADSMQAVFGQRMADDLDNLGDKSQSFMEQLQDGTAAWAKSYADNLNDMLWSSETTFDGILQSFGKMITEMLIQSAMVDLLGDSSKSGGSSGLLSQVGNFAVDYFSTPSAADGYDIPAGVNPMTQLHEKEMVLPAKYADTIRTMTGTDGGKPQEQQAPPKNDIRIINVQDMSQVGDYLGTTEGEQAVMNIMQKNGIR